MRKLASMKLNLTVLLLAGSLVHAGAPAQTSPPAHTGKVTNKSPATNCMQPGYNAPSGVDFGKSYEFYAAASFLYLQPIQENMDLGVVSNSLPPSSLVNGYVLDLNYKYKPGFQVGLGMAFEHDDWETYLEYTWFRAVERAQISLYPTVTYINLLPSWQIDDISALYNESGSEKWTLAMNILDWDLARNFYVGTKLTARPFMGMRAAFINQSVKVQYTNSNASYVALYPSTFINQSSSSWGLGPQVGLSSSWLLGKGFYLNSDGELAILFTQYGLHNTQYSSIQTPNEFSINQKNATYLRTHVDLGIGLGWKSYFANHKSHFDLLLDYTFQVFFDQNMFRKAIPFGSPGVTSVPKGNLYLQGLVVNLRFDF